MKLTSSYILEKRGKEKKEKPKETNKRTKGVV
jgi:hypothetical protein